MIRQGQMELRNSPSPRSRAATGILYGSAALFVLALATKLLGYAEKRSLAMLFGADGSLDAYFTALQIGLFGHFLTRGLLRPVVIPLLSEARSRSLNDARTGEESSTFARYSFTWNNSPVDLGRGTYLIAMLSDSCAHCAEIVGALNRLSAEPGFPRIVGLVLGENETLKAFQATFQPSFPTRLIPVLEFFELIGDAPPRFIMIKDGWQVIYWDDEYPDAKKIRTAAKL